MANEIKITVGCHYTNKAQTEQFGNEVQFGSVPRRSNTNSVYLETVYEPTGVDQAVQKYKSGTLIVDAGLSVIDTSVELDTHG